MTTLSLASRHFFAKFDNTGSGKEAEVVSLLTEENDVMIVTKKHSGSLILTHAIYMGGRWHLVVNSKNGTNNEFSIPAEYYLRAQFKAIYGDAMEDKFYEFVCFIGVHSMTLSFEFVTTFLGDHGAKPLLSYAVLVAIAQFDDATHTSRFLGLPEMVELAVQYHLVLNEMWVVPKDSAAQVGRDLHELRWVGGDAEFTAYLDDHAVFKVHSLLPHGLGQGQLLEGLVVMACRTSSAALCSLQALSGSLLASQEALLAGLRAFSADMAGAGGVAGTGGSFVPPDSSGPISDITEFLQQQLTSSLAAASLSGSVAMEGMNPLQQLFQYLLTDIPKKMLRFFNFKRIQRGNNISFIIHVHQDQIFFDYQKNKPVTASQLYRGMEVFIQRESPPPEERSRPYSSTHASLSWEILGISKWKNWNYLKRTFCMRNPLRNLFMDGHDAYMLQVRRQFANWGLPAAYIAENTSLLSAWGHWMLRNGDAKNEFLKQKKTFSYLSYVDQFMPEYIAAPTNFKENKFMNSTLFIYYFEQQVDYSDCLAPLLTGFTISVPEKKTKVNAAKYLPGNVYTVNNGKLPTRDECPGPHFIVAIPPSDDCMDRRSLGQFESFSKQALKHDSSHNSRIVFLTHPTEEEVTSVAKQLRIFNEEHMSKTKYVIAMLAIQPGGGKSTLCQYVLQTCLEKSIPARLISSDHFRMKHSLSGGAGRKASVAAKQEFEDAVVAALRDASTEVIIYDKNIPNMAGYTCLKSVVARAGIPKVELVPVVPDACSEQQAKACLARVLRREEGSHTLTGASTVECYDSVVDFVTEVYIEPCLAFMPVASLLPGAVVVRDFYQLQACDLLEVAAHVVDATRQERNQESASSLDLTGGTYLGLKFELDNTTRAAIAKALGGFCVRESVHVTISHYGQDGEKMLQTADLLKKINISNSGTTRKVTLTRLGLVQGNSGSEEGAKVMAWASCVVEDVNGVLLDLEGLHVTLLVTGFRNMDARKGELAYTLGVVNIEGVDFPIQQIAIEPVTFEAVWSVD